VDEARRQHIERMFRARLSWTVLGGIGLIGLTSDLSVALRGALLGAAIAAFVWLNQPLVAWILATRREGTGEWRPMAIGMALRVVALVLVIGFSW